ncbi:PP2C family protein-serine/threonine phosphatase [Ideonella sp. YS5]|uniref:PP2C family protein-serine/threonine phosphatase n=1 Tax=Ideonella sp. YS5 TaxID=3453714 RepID=UPI003EEA4FDE
MDRHGLPAASLATPIEPRRAAVPQPPAPVVGQQATQRSLLRRIDAAAASSCGPQHAANEDSHSPLPSPRCLFVVADGVGGGAMAQLASRHLVRHLHQTLDGHAVDAARVRAAMLDADRAIAQRIAQVTEAPGAATVALCAPADRFGRTWLVAWVGDCRAYRLPAGDGQDIEALTRDDTFGHLGEQPPDGSGADDPARMVGNGAIAGANVAVHALARGDLLVLCSDGVHKHLETDDWARLLRQPVSLARRCEDVIDQARQRGSVDDATVLVLQRSRWWAGGAS